jgi:hypothetical protein
LHKSKIGNAEGGGDFYSDYFTQMRRDWDKMRNESAETLRNKGKSHGQHRQHINHYSTSTVSNYSIQPHFIDLGVIGFILSTNYLQNVNVLIVYIYKKGEGVPP